MRAGAARSIAEAAIVGLLALSIGGVAAGCKKESLGLGAQTDFPPVPPPAGLVAEFFVAKPQATWTRARESLGPGAKILPSQYPMLVATVLGLSPGVATEIDADVPTVGAVTSDGEKELPVVAIHVRDGARVVLAMTQGADAHYLARVDAPSKVTLLEPKGGETSLAASLGVLGNYLLVGYAPDALLRVGPYAARSVSTHPMPAEDMALIANHQGLAGPLKARLMGWWDDTKKQLDASDQAERQRHGGSAPTFGDPGAALGKADATFQGLFALMGDLAEGRITATFDDAGVHAKALLKPQSGAGVATAEFASMVVGPADSLLDLPDDVTVALLSRDSPDVRAKSAADQVEAMEKILAGKLGDADKKIVDDLFAAWSKGRGDWLLAGASIAEGHRVLYARAAVADQETLERGLRMLLEIPKVPALADPLKHWMGELRVSPPQVADGASVVAIERRAPVLKGDPKQKKRDGDKLEIGWAFDKNVGTFVAAENARGALSALSRTGATGSLRADADTQKMVQALGADAAFTLLVLPIRAVAAVTQQKRDVAGTPAAPVVVSFGRTGADGWFRLDASPAAIREVARVRGLP